MDQGPEHVHDCLLFVFASSRQHATGVMFVCLEIYVNLNIQNKLKKKASIIINIETCIYRKQIVQSLS